MIIIPQFWYVVTSGRQGDPHILLQERNNISLKIWSLVLHFHLYVQIYLKLIIIMYRLGLKKLQKS